MALVAKLVTAEVEEVHHLDCELLSSFETLSLWLAAIVCLIDVVFNTQVIFKMNRLATDMVQMK